MLPKSKRLGKSLVPQVLRQGMTVAAHGFSARVRRLNTDIPSRFAVVIAAKTIRKAVDRNRVRRRVYRLLSQEWPRLQSGLQAVIFVNQRGLADTSLSDFHQALLSLLQQSHILSK
jgi:ribonuclease P protein component